MCPPDMSLNFCHIRRQFSTGVTVAVTQRANETSPKFERFFTIIAKC